MIVLDKHNLSLIDFSRLFIDCVDIQVTDSLESYGLITGGTVRLKNLDTKKLFYHTIVTAICDGIKGQRMSGRVAVCYNSKSTVPETCTLCTYVDHVDLTRFLHNTITTLDVILPVSFVDIRLPFDSACNELKHNTGKSVEIVNNIQSKYNSFNINTYNLSKLKKFTKRYGLEGVMTTFLNKFSGYHLIYG